MFTRAGDLMREVAAEARRQVLQGASPTGSTNITDGAAARGDIWLPIKYRNCYFFSVL
jgi:hypothetical protein